MKRDSRPIINPKVAEFFNAVPEPARQRLLDLRRLVMAVGDRVDPLGVNESLKWGEPSYSTVSGSPVRLGWKRQDPERFALYFHCQTTLVSTFRELYPEAFTFEGNRAIVFQKNDPIPEVELQTCIELALTYHRRKRRPLLGARDLKEKMNNGYVK